LQHAHIVQIHDVGTQEGRPYCALQFVDGVSLDKRLGGTPQPARLAAQLVETLARAMHAAHQRNIIHRDLKPGNVLLGGGRDTPLEGCTAKITDFGLAKRLDVALGQTQTGAVPGTPGYMPPEQALGQNKAVGPLADVYGLGAVLYEMLTGWPPFQDENVLDTLQQVVARDPVPPRTLQPNVPSDAQTICLKCLQKEPAKRYRSAEALADDLRRFQAGEPIQARPAGRTERLWRWCRRRPAHAAATGLAALLVALVVVGPAIFAISVRREEAKTQAALRESQRQSAALELNHALDLAKEGAVGTAMHRFVRSLELAELALPDSDTLCRTIRLNLNAWRPWVSPVRAILPKQPETTCVAFSGDGTTIATASTDRTIHLWHAATGRPRTEPLRRHQHKVLAMAFSPDGTTLVTGDDKGRGWLWDVVTGQHRFEQPLRHEARVAAVAFSPDGKAVVTGSYDGTARLWDVGTGHELPGSPLPHPAAVTAVAVSPNGTKVLTGCEDNRARLWSATTREPVEPPFVHLREITAVAFGLHFPQKNQQSRPRGIGLMLA
jgi:hypothetical protein